MIATMIFAVSLLTLLQFFVSYSRSLIAESWGHELSEQACQISGVTAKTVRADQFKRLLLLIELCPGTGGDTVQVRAVSAYFQMLSLVRILFARTLPAAAQWIEEERGGCTYAALVALDRRITYNRMLTARQTTHLI
jgi:hypothetical protein